MDVTSRTCAPQSAFRRRGSRARSDFHGASVVVEDEPNQPSPDGLRHGREHRGAQSHSRLPFPLTDRAVEQRVARDAGRPRAPVRPVLAERPRRVVVFCETPREHRRVFNRHAAALPEVRRQRVRRVAEERRASLAPTLRGRAVECRVPQDCLRRRRADEFADGRAPTLEETQQLLAMFNRRLSRALRLVRRRPPARAPQADRPDAEALAAAVKLHRRLRQKRLVFDLRDAAPDRVAAIDRLAVAEQLSPCARVNAVRGDKHVALDFVAVAEARAHNVPLLHESLEPLSESDRVRRQRAQQCALQVRAVECDARHVFVREREPFVNPPAAVEPARVSEKPAALRHRFAQAEAAQDTHRVRPDGNRRSDFQKRRSLLEHARLEPLAPQRQRRRQPADAAADDHDPHACRPPSFALRPPLRENGGSFSVAESSQRRFNLNFMRWSQYFIPTLREDPADAEVVSHRLLLRAGYIRQLGAGIYSFLPLGWRVAQRAMKIIREEMDAIGGQEFFLPALHPAELWKESGRWAVMGETMFRLKDRKGTDLCLGFTHEEIFTSIARHEIRSYKQLPQMWYQIQTKFRDEERPKSGLMRLRQFIMKDAYTFDVDRAGLDVAFGHQREAYKKIFDRCGIKYHIVEASSGAMGGTESNEFMARTSAGEDFIAVCEHFVFSVNLEMATSCLPFIEDESGPYSPE